MKTEVQEIGSDNKVRFGVRFVICGNDETILDGLVARDDYDARDEAALIVSAVDDAIMDTLGVGCEIESNFMAWHGGKYSGQAAMHGWTIFSPGVWQLFSAAEIFDEDGDPAGWEDWECAKIDELPGELRAKFEAALETIQAAHTAACEQVSAADDGRIAKDA